MRSSVREGRAYSVRVTRTKFLCGQGYLHTFFMGHLTGKVSRLAKDITRAGKLRGFHGVSVF